MDGANIPQPVATIGSNGFTMTAGYLPVYHFDAYGCYTGTDSQYFPLGVSAPANCTTIAPPASVGGQIAVWSATQGAWSMVPDYRGQTWYDRSSGAPFTVSSPGVPDVSLYSDKPMPGSDYLKTQARSGLTWCSQQASLAVMMSASFSPEMKAYVTALSALSNGTDTTSTALPTQPVNILAEGVAAT